MTQPQSSLLILVRGANDVGSAVAHRLFTAGHDVVIHELPEPTTARRRMSFTDAVFDGHVTLEGVEARRSSLDEVSSTVTARGFIPVIVEDFGECLQTLRPHVLVDARMRKHSQPEVQRGSAELTIGLGPNFSAGETTDLAIETNWGESLGQIVEYGKTNPLQGEPREIEGHARDRYVYAPLAGIFRTSLQIGDLVAQGQEVGRVDSAALLAPITGILRGLTRDGVFISAKTKVIEVDPRAEGAQISGIGERPARIAEGVFTAIQNWEAKHVH